VSPEQQHHHCCILPTELCSVPYQATVSSLSQAVFYGMRSMWTISYEACIIYYRFSIVISSQILVVLVYTFLNEPYKI
jgi:hypothetical protein